ncbi:MAG: metallophosphoesterase family protein [Myxococcales bacterium]|nr:metallophosphoesterase family protein [Myxococcales bacterium]
MPTIIVLSDIHGNLGALRAAYADIQKRPYDALFCLGDVAAFGPQPEECVTFLRDTVRPTVTIAGNTDRYLVERTWESDGEAPHQQALAWTHRALSEASRSWLAALPATHRETIGGVDVELVHGAPGDDERGLGPTRADARVAADSGFDAAAAAALFAKHGPGLTFAGHTHIPWRVTLGQRQVINVGSVGFPFDGDRRAAYTRMLLVDGTAREYECRRVPYPVAETIARLEAAGAPWLETLVRRLRFSET